MGLIQRVLRPIINYLVERFFPEAVFYGNDLPKKWGIEGATGDARDAVTLETLALALVGKVAAHNLSKVTVTLGSVTYKGYFLGDWAVTLEEIPPKCPDDETLH